MIGLPPNPGNISVELINCNVLHFIGQMSVNTTELLVVIMDNTTVIYNTTVTSLPSDHHVTGFVNFNKNYKIIFTNMNHVGLSIKSQIVTLDFTKGKF